jgi:hypothetical protein
LAKIDYEYQISEAQIKRYQQVPLIDRLRWLEEICIFTKMVRQAPVKERGTPAPTNANTKVQKHPGSAD